MNKDIENELIAIKNEMLREQENDVVQRTLSKLIAIEKEAVYGAKVSNKNSKIEKIIESEFNSYKERIDAAKKD